MSNPLEETETLLSLLVSVGLVGFTVWLLIQLKNPDSALRQWFGKALGATGTPGTANYVSAGENASRWNELMFGSDGGSDQNAPTITYVSAEAVPNPNNPTELVSPSDAAASYSLAETGGLDLGGYGQVQDPSLVMPDGGAVFSWLQKNKVF